MAFEFKPEGRRLRYGDGEGIRWHRLRRGSHRVEQQKRETVIDFRGLQLIDFIGLMDMKSVSN